MFNDNPPENPADIAALVDLFSSNPPAQVRSPDTYEHRGVDPVIDALVEVADGLGSLAHRLRVLAQELRRSRPR